MASRQLLYGHLISGPQIQCHSVPRSGNEMVDKNGGRPFDFQFSHQTISQKPTIQL
jgi:hypothetical protein